MTIAQQERWVVRLLFVGGLVGTVLWCGFLVGLGWTIARWWGGQ